MKKLIIIFFFLSTLIMQAQVRNGFGLRVGGGIPMQEFGDKYKPGFAVGVTLMYDEFIRNPNLTAFIFAGYYAHSRDADDPNLTPEEQVIAEDLLFSSIPVQLGFRYFAIISGEIHPYVEGKVGIQRISVTNEASGVTFSGSTDSENETRIGLDGGIGIQYNLQREMDLDVNVNYTHIFTTGTKTGIVTITAGLILGI